MLRLDPPQGGARQPRNANFPPPRRYTAAEQAERGPGRTLQRLADALSEGRDPLALRLDATGLAPERLLVFELTSDIQNFARAAARIPGLEFLGSDEIQGDDADASPSVYLMIPDAAALRQLVSMWSRFRNGVALPEGFAPWRNLFAQLRDIRVWGPQDRISPEDLEVLAQERVNADGFVRVELELVFRPAGGATEAEASAAIRQSGGVIVSRSRIDGAKYHALLADVPPAEIARVLARGQEGLVASEAVMHIRPQSAVHITAFEDVTSLVAAGAPLGALGDPVVALFDAVPLSGHPRLAGRLSVDDPFDLEPLAVGRRVHGTAMASAALHGDLNGPASESLSRRIQFVNIMFAPQNVGEAERFPDRLPADLFEIAVARMKTGPDATAPHVLVINASVGDRNKPFTGRISGWARVVDYLAQKYGLLFIISAGNHLDDLATPDLDHMAFEDLDGPAKARSALRASAASLAHRRVLAPAESVNALTVGALHADGFALGPLPASTFDVWQETGLCTVSSGLGPGYGNSVKPDVLVSGGRHHVRLLPAGPGHLLRPIGQGSELMGGIVVAAPPGPAAVNLDRVSRTVGTSVAAATLTGIAARAHELLEAAYDDFLAIPGPQRAALLKAVLVHCARWTPARDLIREILGPADNRQHVRQKDNIRRYLGYGAVDAAAVLACAEDRATLWSVGQLQREAAHTFSIPLPVAMSGLPRPHEITATVAWFTPPRVGAAAYRGVRLKLLEPATGKETFAVASARDQPDANQAHGGTVIHRRWTGDRAAALGATATFDLTVQRQLDEIDDPVVYALVTTVTMPGVAEVYAQVRDRTQIRPRAQVPVRP
ncbi:S8 family peptidase [Brevundimonas sp.]|uniref:S8 family peptidase n=1 Tax=Brevundimonas sp. TaxID=1871086 RepID=UPI003D0D0CCE